MFSARGKTNGISGKCWVNGSDAWTNKGKHLRGQMYESKVT